MRAVKINLLKQPQKKRGRAEYAQPLYKYHTKGCDETPK